MSTHVIHLSKRVPWLKHPVAACGQTRGVYTAIAVSSEPAQVTCQRCLARGRTTAKASEGSQHEHD
jgi:hypothetical protein